MMLTQVYLDGGPANGTLQAIDPAEHPIMPEVIGVALLSRPWTPGTALDEVATSTAVYKRIGWDDERAAHLYGYVGTQ